MPTPMAWSSSDIVAAMTDDLSPILAKVLTVSDGVVHGTREEKIAASLGLSGLGQSSVGAAVLSSAHGSVIKLASRWIKQKTHLN
jgi:hypothetical protein